MSLFLFAILFFLFIYLVTFVTASCSDCCQKGSNATCSSAFRTPSGYVSGFCCGIDEIGGACCPHNAYCTYGKNGFTCTPKAGPCSMCCKLGGKYCNKAFNNGPGQCCGTTFGTSHCCPVMENAKCVSKSYGSFNRPLSTFQCQVPIPMNGDAAGASVLMIILALFICACCIYACQKSARGIYQNYYQPQPMYGQPGYAYAPVPQVYHSNEGFGTGFVSGLVVGNMIDSRHHYQPTYSANSYSDYSYGGNTFSAQSDGDYGGDSYDAGRD